MTEEEKHIEHPLLVVFTSCRSHRSPSSSASTLGHNQQEMAPAAMMPCKYYQGEPFSTPCEEDGKVVR